MRFPKVWRTWPWFFRKTAIVIQWERAGPYMVVEPDGSTSIRHRPPNWNYFKRMK